MPDESPPLETQGSGSPESNGRRSFAAPTGRARRWFRALGFAGLAFATVGIGVLGAIWLFDVDFDNETTRAIREYASNHRRTDLRFPGARYTPYKSIATMSDQFDMSASALSIVEADLADTLGDTPGDFDALFATAQIHLLQGNGTKAVDILERLYLFHLEDPDILGALAYGYYLQGRRENRVQDLLKSIGLWEKALTIRTDDLVFLFNLGTCYERVKDRSQAKKLYTRYLALDSESGWAAELKARLIRLDAAR